MKKALILAAGLLLVGAAFIACDGSKPVSARSSVIRLHILANSDSDADQSLKLKVRDRVLENWGSTLSAAGSSAKAWKELQDLLPDIRKDLSSYVKSLGASYGVKLETGVFDFPARSYNGVDFPKGSYQALRVELGAAAGHNWWCVLFPPLCLVGEDGTMDMEQYKKLVQAIEDGDISADQAPEAPVRSWIYDKLIGTGQWDKDFLQWAKDFWLGDDKK